jgi:hypothetical protein
VLQPGHDGVDAPGRGEIGEDDRAAASPRSQLPLEAREIHAEPRRVVHPEGPPTLTLSGRGTPRGERAERATTPSP